MKEAGIKVVPVVANLALATRVERAGADAVVAEGTEAGGHIGETTTMALVPQMVDALDTRSSQPAVSQMEEGSQQHTCWEHRAFR